MEEKIHTSDYLFSNFAVGNQTELKTHLVILNSESFSRKLTIALWNNCNMKVCADGGANRLYDSMSVEERGVYVPQYIVGDLDSLRSDVAEFYQSCGTIVKKVPSQNENDLDKSILLIRSLLETGTTAYVDCLDKGDIAINGATISSDMVTVLSPTARTTGETILIMGAYGGRFDQEMATVSCLFRWLNTFDRVVLLGDKSASYLLQPSVRHHIRCTNHTDSLGQSKGCVVKEGPTCGLIPLGGRVNSITTTGLQWDLNESSLEMGVLVSSSNAILPGAGEVTVETSEPVLWTIELTNL